MNLLTPSKLSTLAVSFTTLALAASAHAAFYEYAVSFSGGGGFRASGLMETKSDAPAAFLEMGPTTPIVPFETGYIQSLSLNVFEGAALISTNNPVSSGWSMDKWLHMKFDSTASPTFLDVDMNTNHVGSDSYYFISNGISPDGLTVPYGSTTFNLFRYVTSQAQATFIGSANEFTVVQVPGPGALGMLALCSGVIRRRRRY